MPDPYDGLFLRRAIALSGAAVARGGRPFGAILCDGDGQVVSQVVSVAPVDPRDWTAYSEMQALRAASAAITWEALGSATIYASAEPCPMWAAAIYWCNIRRSVFCVGI
jgi:tRNA(adenine34) deaminase